MPRSEPIGGSGWSQEQLQNAAIIYRVGRSMGLGSRDIQIALITAIVESGLRNVPYGDRDSLGLFQQRPSQGWGTAAQVMDPTYSARKFFSTLMGIKNRTNMGMGEAAQAVQRSAFPDRYAEHISAVQQMFPTVTKLAGGKPLDMDGNAYPVRSDVPEPPGGTLDVSAAVDVQALDNPVTPEAMLGAWGFDMNSGGNTFIGMGTDALMKQVAQQSQEESGPYTKGVNGWRKAVIEYARSALGKPYVWGGTDLSSGVDCSGLIYSAFAKAGMDIPRVSYAQANYGTRTGLKGLRPGDLWAWDNSSRNNGADHIALYIGNGMILESPRPGSVVRIRKLDPSEGGWGVHLNL